MKSFRGVILAGTLVLGLTVPVYADRSVKTELPQSSTDYYMTVDSGGEGVDIYQGTSDKSEKLNNTTVEDGTVLHIEGETDKNGENWGYTEYNGTHGYVPLDELRPAKDEELAAGTATKITGIPPASENTQKSNDTDNKKTDTDSENSEANAESTADKSQDDTVQNTDKITAENNSEDSSQTDTRPVNGTASKSFKEDSTWYKNPFLWIGVVTVLAVIGILGYHLKKR